MLMRMLQIKTPYYENVQDLKRCSFCFRKDGGSMFQKFLALVLGFKARHIECEELPYRLRKQSSICTRI